jgi:hypothetical protein
MAPTGTAQRISRRAYRYVVQLRIAPEIISVMDYSRRCGHADLIISSERDLDLHVSLGRHRRMTNVTEPSTHDLDER